MSFPRITWSTSVLLNKIAVRNEQKTCIHVLLKSTMLQLFVLVLEWISFIDILIQGIAQTFFDVHLRPGIYYANKQRPAVIQDDIIFLRPLFYLWLFFVCQCWCADCWLTDGLTNQLTDTFSQACITQLQRFISSLFGGPKCAIVMATMQVSMACLPSHFLLPCRYWSVVNALV